MSDVSKPPDERSDEDQDEVVFKRGAEGSPEEGEGISEEAQHTPEEVWTEVEAQEPQQPVQPTQHAAPAPQEPAKRRRRTPSFFWPIVLIGAGVLLLLSNLGYISWTSWNLLLRLWPVLLIALGIDLLFGGRSMAGAILSGLLILILLGGVVAIGFFAQQIPALRGLAQPAEWQVEQIEYPLTGLERARILIDWSSVPGTLRALERATNLIEGQIAYRGELLFDVRVRGAEADVEIDQRFSGVWFGPLDTLRRVEQRWLIEVSPDVDLDLTLNGGSGRWEADLRGLQVSDLNLDVGSGPVDLYLPGEGTFDGAIEGGSGPLAISVPDGIGVRVVLQSGSGPFRPSERFSLVSGERDDDGVWETGNWRTADERIELQIDQGSGPITIR
jgi:hypothetical protein